MEEKNEISAQERDYSSQIIGIIRRDRSDEMLRAELDEYHEKDVAGIFEELTAAERERLRRVLGSERMSEIVSFLDDAGEYLSEITADNAKAILLGSGLFGAGAAVLTKVFACQKPNE